MAQAGSADPRHPPSVPPSVAVWPAVVAIVTGGVLGLGLLGLVLFTLPHLRLPFCPAGTFLAGMPVPAQGVVAVASFLLGTFAGWALAFVVLGRLLSTGRRHLSVTRDDLQARRKAGRNVLCIVSGVVVMIVLGLRTGACAGTDGLRLTPAWGEATTHRWDAVRRLRVDCAAEPLAFVLTLASGDTAILSATPATFRDRQAALTRALASVPVQVDAPKRPELCPPLTSR